MQFRPDAVEQFKAIFEANWQQIKGFEGCSHVELLQDENNPCVFFTYSLWSSQAKLDAYRNSDLFGRVWGTTKQLFSHKPEAWSVKQVLF